MQHNLKEEKLSMKLEETIKMFIKPQTICFFYTYSTGKASSPVKSKINH
jgi:hypothetical protein